MGDLDIDEILKAMEELEESSDGKSEKQDVITYDDSHHYLADKMLENISESSDFKEVEIVYPHILLEGLTCEEEIEHFRHDKKSENDIVLVVRTEDGLYPVGYTQFNLKELLHLFTLRSYKAILRNSKTDVMEIDEHVLTSLILT